MAHLDQTLRALADPTRRHIVGRLAHGSATVSELVDCFDLTQPTISSHLKVLEKAGLIVRGREAQTRPCRLVPGRLEALSSWLGELGSTYQSNYAQLDQLLDALQNDTEID